MAATSSSSSPATTSNKEDELASLGDLEGLEHDEIQLLRKLKPFDRAIIDISYIFISSQAFRKIMELSVETLLAAKFTIKDGTEPASTPLFSIEMKSLQLLEVHLSNLPLPPNVFLLFKMPNLKILKIASNDYSYCRPCDFKLIRTLVGGSLCFNLTHLRIANVEITGSANPPAARDTTFCERQRNSMNSSGKDVHLEFYTLFKLLPHLRELCLPSNAYIHPSTLLLIGLSLIWSLAEKNASCSRIDFLDLTILVNQASFQQDAIEAENSSLIPMNSIPPDLVRQFACRVQECCPSCIQD